VTTVKALRLDDRRERILTTATSLFSRHGFTRTSIGQVAEEARVSKGLIFWHFQSKDRLFHAALERVLDPCTIDIDEERSALGGIGRLIDEYFAFVSTHLTSVRFLLNLVVCEGHRDEVVGRVIDLQRAYRELLAAGLEGARGNGLVSVPERRAPRADLILATLHGILLESILNPGDSRSAEVLLQHLKRRLIEDPAPQGDGRQQGGSQLRDVDANTVWRHEDDHGLQRPTALPRVAPKGEG
jgi:AcrR family transcriptional regulator